MRRQLFTVLWRKWLLAQYGWGFRSQGGAAMAGAGALVAAGRSTHAGTFVGSGTGAVTTIGYSTFAATFAASGTGTMPAQWGATFAASGSGNLSAVGDTL